MPRSLFTVGLIIGILRYTLPIFPNLEHDEDALAHANPVQYSPRPP